MSVSVCKGVCKCVCTDTCKYMCTGVYIHENILGQVFLYLSFEINFGQFLLDLHLHLRRIIRNLKSRSLKLIDAEYMLSLIIFVL